MPSENGAAARARGGGDNSSGRASSFTVIFYRTDPIAATALISVEEAVRRTGRSAATIIQWIIRHKIGRHVRNDRGPGGNWKVDPDRLEALAEREAAS